MPKGKRKKNEYTLLLLEEVGKTNFGKFIHYREEERKKFTFGNGCVEYLIKVDTAGGSSYPWDEVKLGKFKESYVDFVKELSPDEELEVLGNLKRLSSENLLKLFSKK